LTPVSPCSIHPSVATFHPALLFVDDRYVAV
jgi:hypothetical protein